MEDIEIIEDVKPIKKGNKKILLIVIGVIILLLCSFCGIFIINNNSKSNTTVVDEKKDEISDEVKKELLNIVDLEETGHKQLTEAELKRLGHEESGYINISHNELYSTFVNMETNVDLIINELSDYDKKEIVFKYANTNDMTSVDNCNFYIDKDTYEKVIKLYGIDSINFEESEIVDDKYNFNLSCSKNVSVAKVDDSVTFEKQNNSIVLNYVAKINDDIYKKIKFTFNQRDDQSYYLYKVNVKNE